MTLLLRSTQPRVCVVVCAYNAERTIETAIASALNQSIADVEIVVCDDASTDRTREVVRSLQDPRVQLLANEVNLGPGPSRDRAISSATSEWIAFLDADDEWCTERLHTLLQATAGLACDVIFDDLMLCHDTEEGLVPFRPLHRYAAFGGKDARPRQVTGEILIKSKRLLVKPMIRTDFIRSRKIIHSDRRFAEDAEFLLRLVMHRARIVYLPLPLYRYRISPGSLTAMAKNNISAMRTCIEDCAKWDGWWPSAEDALDFKIDSLRDNESLYAFARLLFQGRLLEATLKMINSPRILALLPARTWNLFRYQLHRKVHGGRRR